MIEEAFGLGGITSEYNYIGKLKKELLKNEWPGKEMVLKFLQDEIEDDESVEWP